MALAAVQTAMNLEEKKHIHPFFSKAPQSNAPDQQALSIEAPADDANNDPQYEQQENAPKGHKKRGRKPGSTIKKKESPAGKSQSRLEKFTQPSAGQDAAEGVPVNAPHILSEPTLEEDPNSDRRKRRKTDSPAPAQSHNATSETPAIDQSDWHQQLKLEAGKTMVSDRKRTHVTIPEPLARDLATVVAINRVKETSRATTPPNDITVEPGPNASQPLFTSTIDKTTPKKKTIKISKNGKLLSSPPKVETESTPPRKRRARKSKLKVAPTVTIIKYGHDTAGRQSIGEQIEAILNGSKVAPRPAALKKARLKKAPPKPFGPPKPTHPFFLGKPAQKSDESVASIQVSDGQSLPSPRAYKKSAVTPGKLRVESRGLHSSIDMPAFGLSGRDRTPKQGGLIEAPWPGKETAHVRNQDKYILPDYLPTPRASLIKARKMKNNVLLVPDEESLMARLASQLRPSIQGQDTVSQSDFAPPKDVRLPTRLLTTGVNIQREVQDQVPSLSASYKQLLGAAGTHPAVKALFVDIKHNLTPFDLGKCEPLSWLQKYAPKYASHVLQTGQEPLILKDWLQSLTVLTVSSAQEGPKTSNALDPKKPPKKKRKKAHDDFIVNSDEEDDEDMIELSTRASEYEMSDSSASSSLRRARWTRNKNVVLISGPHGCGKSAMVQAAAKDLGFEVFEINSGSRRSGKDIQDKVGDMTENHLVSHKRTDMSSKSEAGAADDTDTERHSEALQKDLDSGRQGTMMSFFSSKGPAKEKPIPKPESFEPPEAATSGQPTLSIAQSQRKSQKQSLILIEEADILYDEDQGFWAQVTRLASQSKRPIIITCTIEALIPIHELPLAAILRLSPPPIDLATDYMVVLAGHEGHVLERDAVSTLYRSKNYDLRASIAELNFWCQMSVGDRKGGLEWFYQRWPPGKDKDENGRLLRVASKGTYAQGMGCLSHNVFKSQNNIGFDRTEELLKESWEEWGINPHDWNGREDQPTISSDDALEDLKRLDSLADSISAADTYCCIDMPSYERYLEQPTDPSLPPVKEKARLSYTLAAPVIQVDHISDFSHFDRDMLIHNHLLIQRIYGGLQVSDPSDALHIPATQQDFTKAIVQYKERQNSKYLSRPDFSQAFDILAFHPDTLHALNTSYNLTASSFDRTFKIVAEDLAPYVRSIVASELVLENQRLRMGTLLSEGGSLSNKRQRTTRAARTALEGGSRDTKRRERWFGQDLNRALVMGTAGRTWAGLGVAVAELETESKTEGSTAGTQDE
ncbi:hypothetical protein N0V90_010423 [Kalmusia sp. IMI 367209]|nr:hypothetical protein N0V90_010423 [Kalmusia sp. IMI 367209]